MLKAAIVILLLATVASLFSGLFFLVKDEGHSNRLVTALTVRVVLAVITLAPETREPVRAFPVWDDPLDFVAAPEHPLARNGAVTLADVARHPAVFPGDNTFTHHIVRRLFEAENLSPNIGMSTNYLETIKMMVSIGLAWSVLPRTMLDEQVACLPLAGIQLRRQLGYILHSERTLSNAAKAFMALLDAQADLAPTEGNRLPSIR